MNTDQLLFNPDFTNRFKDKRLEKGGPVVSDTDH